MAKTAQESKNTRTLIESAPDAEIRLRAHGRRLVDAYFDWVAAGRPGKAKPART